MENVIRIGVVGYSTQKFDEQKAKNYIFNFFNTVKKPFEHYKTQSTFVVISGLTNMGIPMLAYREATKRNWKTVGIACSKAKDMDCYPVDFEKIVGNEWGEESETFLNSIDILLKIGGGKQSAEEFKKAKSMGLDCEEYELKAE